MKYSNRIVVVTIFEEEKVNDLVKISVEYLEMLKYSGNAYFNFTCKNKTIILSCNDVIVKANVYFKNLYIRVYGYSLLFT